MRKKISLICLFISAAMLLCVGCAGSAKEEMAYASEDMAFAQTSAAEAPMAAPAPVMEEAAAEMEYVSAGSGVYEEGSGSVANNYGNHKIISTHYIEMKTDEFDTHLEMLQSRANSLGGYVQSSSISGTKPETYNDRGRTANYTFRIPTDRANEFVEFTKGTGVITYIDCNTEDVTLTYYDSETRLEVLRTQLERLQSILIETDNLADIIELEREIANVTLEIEQHTSQLRRYDDLIDFTTVNIFINENRLASGPAARETFGERIARGLSENLSGLGVFLENSVVWLISALPVIIFIAILAAVIIFIARLFARLFKKNRERRRIKKEAKAAQRRAKMDAIANPNKEETNE